MISEKNILIHELIGLNARVAKAPSANLIGLCGMVVDETRNTLLFEEKSGREVRVPKASATFAFTLPSGSEVPVNGSGILFNPVERLKKLARKIW